jgi:hypothetical protein
MGPERGNDRKRAIDRDEPKAYTEQTSKIPLPIKSALPALNEGHDGPEHQSETSPGTRVTAPPGDCARTCLLPKCASSELVASPGNGPEKDPYRCGSWWSHASTPRSDRSRTTRRWMAVCGITSDPTRDGQSRRGWLSRNDRRGLALRGRRERVAGKAAPAAVRARKPARQEGDRVRKTTALVISHRC